MVSANLEAVYLKKGDKNERFLPELRKQVR
jgi:hypothetical protein